MNDSAQDPISTPSLSGKVACVTGGGSGLGRSIALQFGSAGAHVAILELNREAGEHTVEDLRRAGHQAELVLTDVSDSAQVQSAFDRIAKTFGTLDILINNAGISRTGPFTHEVTDKDWTDSIGVMQNAVLFCMRSAALMMIPRRSGSIINISSIRGFSPIPGRMTYSPPKAAVIMMTKIAAGELGRYGIRVNAIAPGFIKTAMHDADVARGMTNEEHYLRLIPVGRFGLPEEIGALAIFLCSEAASYITGSCITIDGGLTTIAAG